MENSCFRQWSSNMNRMIEWEMHVPLPELNIIRHFLVENEKVGLKLLFYSDTACRQRQTVLHSTATPPLKQNPKHTFRSIIIKFTKREVLEISESFQNRVSFPLQCLYIGLPLHAFPVNKAYWFLILRVTRINIQIH